MAKLPGRQVGEPSRLPGRRRLALALAAGLALGGCDPSAVGGIGASVVPPAEEAQMGDQAWAEIKAKTPIDHDPALQERVERVGRRIVAASGAAIPPSRWDFVVFDTSEVNAFALPGGHVGVYRGMFNVVQDDAQLATVLGHEIGHVNAHHPAQRAGLGAITGGVVDIGAALLGLGQLGAMAGETAGQLGMLAFSRSQESQADELGLAYMARAGYDPAESITFWQRMSGATARGGKPPAFLSTHPPDQQRIADLQAQLPAAERIYLKNQAG